MRDSGTEFNLENSYLNCPTGESYRGAKKVREHVIIKSGVSHFFKPAKAQIQTHDAGLIAAQAAADAAAAGGSAAGGAAAP